MSRHVLVADDEAHIRESMRKTLEGAGYRVSLAGDGREALAAIADEPPEALVLDVMMPRMDGFEVLKRLQAEAATADLPVIMVVARTADSDFFREWNPPGCTFLIMPFEAGALLEAVASRLTEQASDCVETEQETLNLVLVAEDQPHVRKLIETTLLRSWYRVATVADGQEALDAVRREPPDAIVLDYRLPVIGAAEVMRALQSDQTSAGIRVVVLTAKDAATWHTPEGTEAAAAFLTMPFNPQELVTLLRRALGESRV